MSVTDVRPCATPAPCRRYERSPASSLLKKNWLVVGFRCDVGRVGPGPTLSGCAELDQTLKIIRRSRGRGIEHHELGCQEANLRAPSLGFGERLFL